MKAWNKIFEHHDTEWPQEILSMTVDQLLDKLEEMQLDAEYSTIENILKMHLMENPTVDVEISNKIPTWDEIADREPTAFDSMMDKDSWMDL
jgi:hypothetical protein